MQGEQWTREDACGKYLVLMAYEAFAPVEFAELQVVGLIMKAAATLADSFCFSTVVG